MNRSENYKCKAPLVSIVIPSYNHICYVEDAIASIMEQNYSNIELLVIDDGSTDGSREFLQSLQKQYHFTLELQKNIGVSATLNKALERTSGDFFLALASDDLLLPSAIENLLKELQKDKSIGAVFGDAYYINSKSQKVFLDQGRKSLSIDTGFETFLTLFFHLRPELRDLNYIGTYESLLLGNYIPPGVLLKREALKTVNGYEEDLRIEDYSLWLKLTKHYKVHYINSVTTKYRIHDSNSIYVENMTLLSESLRIIAEEKTYCKKMGYYSFWQESYGLLRIKLILKKKQYWKLLNINLFLVVLKKFFLKKPLRSPTS